MSGNNEQYTTPAKDKKSTKIHIDSSSPAGKLLEQVQLDENVKYYLSFKDIVKIPAETPPPRSAIANKDLVQKKSIYSQSDIHNAGLIKKNMREELSKVIISNKAILISLEILPISLFKS